MTNKAPIKDSAGKWGLASRHLPLIAIMIIALGLRLWNLFWGLPDICHPDEPFLVGPAARMADICNLDFDPKFYQYPALQMYILSACMYLHGVFAAGGSWLSPALDPIGVGNLARLVTALFGSATVAVLYIIAYRHFSRRVAIAAGLLLAVLPYHALDSHYVNGDIPMTFWILLACLFLLEYTARGKLWCFFLGACCIGFGGATKYTALATMPMLPAAVFLYQGANSGTAARLRLLMTGLIICAGTFLICSPFTVLQFHEVLAAIQYESRHMQGGHRGADLVVGGGWIYHRFVYQLAAGFPFAAGLPLYLLAVGGAICAVRHMKKTWLLLGAGILPIFAAVGLSIVVFKRYLIPFLPFIALLAAQGIAYITAGAVKRSVKICAAVFVGITILYTTALTVSHIRILEPVNSRIACRWINKNVPRGDHVLFLAFGFRPDNVLAEFQKKYRLEFLRSEGSFMSYFKKNDMPEWIVATSWFTTIFERGTMRNRPLPRYLKQILESEHALYEPVVQFKSAYLNEHLYGRLDPYFKNEFNSPDYTIYRLKADKAVPRHP